MPQSDKYMDVDWAFGVRLRGIREGKGMTAAQLAARSGVSVRTVELLEAGAQRRPRRNTVAQLAAATNETVQTLIEPKPAKILSGICSKPIRFGDLQNLVRGIDSYLIALVRDHRHADSRLLAEEHRDLVRSRLTDAGVPLDQFIALFEDSARLRQLCESLPKPDLIVSVEPEFEGLTFEAGEHQLRVEHPLLLWDCHCKTPGTPAGPDACPIHSQPGCTEISDAMSNGHVEIRWRSLRIRWQRDVALWPPAIDSFLLLHDLGQSGLLNERCRRLLDVGCGTGFLSIAISLQNKTVTHVTVVDWLLQPLLYSAVNFALNLGDAGRPKVTPKLTLLGDLVSQLSGGLEGADLAVCNPPYLPLLTSFESLGQHSSVAGTDLLSCVIRQATRLARKTVIQFSHVAAPEADLAAAAAGMHLVPLGAERLVPFRVLHALERGGYVAALQRERGLERKQHDRHVYWHRLRTYSVVGK